MEPKPVPDYADLIPLAVFEQACISGSFTDDDGTGYYVKDGLMHGHATPSWIRHRVVDRTATHVAWFNK